MTDSIRPPIGHTALGPGALILHVEDVMGTAVTFAIRQGEVADEVLESTLDRSCQALHGADSIFSTWIPNSPLSQLRRGELAADDYPDDFHEVFKLCAEARDLSGGWFDPWAMPGGYDPTGLVKGWAIDRAMDILVSSGIPGAMINGGGDIAAFGLPAPDERWRIGVQHPWLRDALACVIEVDSAVATSGSYERGIHLTDPHTGEPATPAASATVTGPNLAMADAFATALAVGGDEAFSLIDNLAGYAAYLIRYDGSERIGNGIAVVP